MNLFSTMQKVEGLNYLNLVTKAYSNQLYTQAYSAPLYAYIDLIEQIKKRKSFRIFTNNPTAYSHPSVPNLYVTNLGHLVLQVVKDNVINPYTNGVFQNALIHPEINLLSQLMIKHNINSIFMGEYQLLEHICETCFADFKVHIQTRAFTIQNRRWSYKYSCSVASYNRFLEFILRETERFEVHSLVIQRKLRNGRESAFGDLDFRDMSAYEIAQEKSNQIIQTVWRNRHKNNVLGILSREEVDIDQTCTVRLLFFVRKKFSDLVPFKDTPLYNAIEPFFKDLNLDRVALGEVYTMNSGIAPLYQEQEQNYYDINQVHVGNRLNILKTQLTVPDYWFRIRDQESSLKIERGQAHFER
ncbi:hypothetical protein [Acinetobacter oleivorans]|uniref:hypothetical protein n=1 Tax=Acinetobacter oleivorans TaxID=1148157 RepID=UPI0019010490|nr:hypothetical protein [Acinetobacter oleivorans]MBJ8496990.1 hypothetical protein [Acinetobacter oleivorans]